MGIADKEKGLEFEAGITEIRMAIGGTNGGIQKRKPSDNYTAD